MIHGGQNVTRKIDKNWKGASATVKKRNTKQERMRIMRKNDMTRGQRKREAQREARREFVATMAGTALAIGGIWMLMAVFAAI